MRRLGRHFLPLVSFYLCQRCLITENDGRINSRRCLFSPEKATPKKRRKVFCQITQHLLENHEMWKKVIAEENQKQAQGAEPVHLNNVAEPILAIHEEEEESGSREELIEGEDPEEEPEWPVALREDSKPQEQLEEGDPQWNNTGEIWHHSGQGHEEVLLGFLLTDSCFCQHIT